MKKKRIASLLISSVFLAIAIYNFSRDLNPLSLFLNVIGFSIFLLLLLVNLKKSAAK